MTQKSWRRHFMQTDCLWRQTSGKWSPSDFSYGSNQIRMKLRPMDHMSNNTIDLWRKVRVWNYAIGYTSKIWGILPTLSTTSRHKQTYVHFASETYKLLCIRDCAAFCSCCNLFLVPSSFNILCPHILCTPGLYIYCTVLFLQKLGGVFYKPLMFRNIRGATIEEPHISMCTEELKSKPSCS
jgi:hypothetical protein